MISGALTPGSLLSGRYLLGAVLGEGGSAVVLRAHDQFLERDVAIKVLSPTAQGGAAGEARALFHRGCMSLARLHHPAIIPVYDYSGQDSDPLYLVTPVVEGRALDVVRDSYARPLPEKAVLAIGVEWAEALQYAHERHIIHRDVKPGNAYLTPSGHVLLGDFSLAKDFITPQTGAGLPARTSVFGSPFFMAPEQLAKEPQGPATDVFSLGATLYELACGAPPFLGRTMPEVLARLNRCDYPAPRSCNPALSAELECFIADCLRRRPEDRCRSAGLAGERLGALLERAGVGSTRVVLRLFVACLV
jgi:eukaryotic-like serine/threonine-protein kinase